LCHLGKGWKERGKIVEKGMSFHRRFFMSEKSDFLVDFPLIFKVGITDGFGDFL
jgi:hypothetical protein